MTVKLRVVVTGGSGRIGSEVIRALLARGHKPVNLDLAKPAIDNCPYLKIDMTDRQSVRDAIKGADAVCHLAEIPNIMEPLTEDGVFSANTASTAHVLQAAADFKLKHAIYTSTCQVYGCWGFHQIPPERLPFDEELPLRPQNAYALSKVANEGFARLMTLRHNLSIAIFRFPWVMSKEIETAQSSGWPLLRQASGEVDGFGTYLHVSDAASAYVASLENPRPGCEAYHFVADDVFSATPIRARIRESFKNFPELPETWPDFQTPVSTRKAKTLLGWAPKFSAREAHQKFFGHLPAPERAPAV